MSSNEEKFQESEQDISTCLDQIHYLIKSDQVNISFEKNRPADSKRDLAFTNRYTMGVLFPDESETNALKRELMNLKMEDYIGSINNNNFPNLPPLRVFGKKYSNRNVYIKLRIEVLSTSLAGRGLIIVISFHFAEWNFESADFPYRR